MPVKIAWGITGAGDLIEEVFDIMEEISQINNLEMIAVVSKAGETVLKWYKLRERLDTIAKKVLIEKDANTPFIVGNLQTGKYKCLIVAPATANSVAKIVNGIADTLITNCVSQTNKTNTGIYILPVDRKKGTIKTILPDGETFELTMRDIDVENTEKLRKMKGVSVIESPGEIREIIKGYVEEVV